MAKEFERNLTKHTVLNTGTEANPIYKEIPVCTDNEWALHAGENLPNHSSSLIGRGKFVRVGSADPLIFRTRQQAYRLAAYLLAMAEILPDEVGEHTWEQVLEAIETSR